MPCSTASRSSSPRLAGSGRPATMRYLPECALSARTVATMTAASGRRPELRHFMSTIFSKPRSLPKPLSVTT